MKKVKRGLAAIMAALLMVPSQSIMAGAQLPSQDLVLEEAAEKGEKEKKASPGNAQEAEEKKGEEKAEEQEKASAKKLEKKAVVEKEEIIFNTGKHEYSVVDRDSFFEEEIGDAVFEEDGSYTINIPEENPFFPYEVEFIYQGKRERKWFMTPDAEVEIGGHVFYVSASFDGDVVTQMSLNVGGESVIVYPEEKEFTNEDEGEIVPASLLPLEQKNLSVDLTGYTPLELTMIRVDDLFIGGEMADGDKVMWTRYDDDYTISMLGDKLDLSYDTYEPYDGFVDWKMIVGKDDQLAGNNICYYVSVKVTPSSDWLNPSIYFQDNEGNRIEQDLTNVSYYDYDDDREFQMGIVDGAWGEGESGPVYISLSINDSLFPKVNFDHIKVYEGKFISAEEAISGTEITNKLLNVNMEQKDDGYPMLEWDNDWVTMVAFDSDSNAVGCLPFFMSIFRYTRKNGIHGDSFWKKDGEDIIYISDSYSRDVCDGVTYLTFSLYREYAADREYYLKLHCRTSYEVTAAYVGKYSSIKEAVAAGAKDIKDELFVSSGYCADYSKGVFFTVFAGKDENNVTETYYCMVNAETGLIPDLLNDNTWVWFDGLNDSNKNYIGTKVIESDDYGDGSYLTMLVDENVDLSSLAPRFSINDKANLYAAGSKEPEISGKTLHDFSQGPVQYTVSAEDGVALKNIWLQVVKVGVGNGRLYINSLGDKDAKTKVENGVTYSTREMIIDGRYDYQHDIVLINLGEEEIPEISAVIVSDEVELDKYWTLKGGYELPDVGNGGTAEYGEYWNLAKLRVRPKEGAADGRDITGTLTIKSGEKELIVLTLTGTVGDPSITTKEIPEAVKYVPYGTMIQNSNKYDWNKVRYQLVDGKLPEGMEMRENGELYGVPKETGSFTFTVWMRNSYNRFSSSERTFTLTVAENTDANVDNATDKGYTLTQRVQNMNVNNIYGQTLVSDGTYGEFVDIFLDGEKLEKDVDYTSEEGSTRIAISGETLKKRNSAGRHTLGIEFRTGDAKVLKRAAQNYEIRTKNQNNNTNNNSSSSSRSSSGRRNNIVNTPSIPRDPKKGYYNTQTGIITGTGDGYSHWVKDDFGWKLIYADGTPAIGQVIQLADQTAAEQVIWEQIDGVWYAFGITGYLKSGWICDYQLNGWYCMTEYGMYSGWYGDEQDHCVYYLEPGTGKLAAGWKNIDGKWYYFNETTTIPTWNFNAVTGVWVYNPIAGHKPYGAAYINEQTPDGYFVGIDGVWDGQEIQN